MEHERVHNYNVAMAAVSLVFLPHMTPSSSHPQSMIASLQPSVTFFFPVWVLTMVSLDFSGCISLFCEVISYSLIIDIGHSSSSFVSRLFSCALRQLTFSIFSLMSSLLYQQFPFFKLFMFARAWYRFWSQLNNRHILPNVMMVQPLEDFS